MFKALSVIFCRGKMTIAYLDQNKWIDLARAYHGKHPDPTYTSALEAIREGIQQQTLVLPLSAIHYLELFRIKDSARRARLGKVMWELSRGYTLASTTAILFHELEVSLSRRFPHIICRPFTLLAKGAAHAFGVPRSAYRVPPEARQTMSPRQVRHFEAEAETQLERATLTGIGPNGEPAPPFLATEHKENFKSHLENLPATAAQVPREQWDDLLCAISLLDIHEPLQAILQYHGLVPFDLLGRGKSDLAMFIEELPTRRIDLHLHRQVLRNPSLKPKLTDMEDWAGLGTAAAYCDVLVCEKHFANLLGRDGFQPVAKVITDVRELPLQLGTTGHGSGG
jgi:hypothetical protein